MNVSKTAVALAILSSIQPVSAFAETTEQEVERIQVSGFRQSLIENRDLKRQALGSQDSIVAEDIADFPDLNLADSLQRIPGIAITREGGEGRQISLRGLGPDFTRVELNGMDILSTNGSSMDSRGQGGRSRSFDFNIFASELFSQIDVQKSYRASMDEGGIGGTVSLRPAKPFDYSGFNAAVSAQAGTNSLTSGTSPRMAALVSNTWQDLGMLFSVAYSSRDTMERGANTYQWRPLTASGADISNLDETTQALINAGQLRFARGNRYSVWENEQERLGLTTSLQYRPSDRFRLDADVLYAELNNQKDEHHLMTRGAGQTALSGPQRAGGTLQGGTVINELIYNDLNEVVYADFSNVTLATESRRQQMDTRFYQASTTLHWQLAEHSDASLLLGTSESKFTIPVSDKIYYEGFGGLITDYRPDRFYVHNSYDFDLSDRNRWKMHEIDLDESNQTSRYDTFKLALETEIGDISALHYGLSWRKFTDEGQSYRWHNVYEREWESGTLDNTLSDSYFRVFNKHDRASWAAANVAANLAYYNVDADLSKNAQYLLSNGTYDISEKSKAAWLEYNWQAEVVRGSIGLRYVTTDVVSGGYLQTGGGTNYLTVSQDYSKLLPAFLLVWDISDDLLWRSSVSKNLTRPSLGAMALTGSVNTDLLVANIGNPGLKPFESVNYESSLEWYYSDAGYLSVAVFYKDIDNFVLSQRRTVAFSETGLPASLLAAGQTPATLFELNAPINAQQTSIKGMEFALQRDFDFLPAPFNQAGVIANYTYADGKLDYYDGNTYLTTREFAGLSKDTANLTLYYETEQWGGRVSAAYRSSYVTFVTPLASDGNEGGFHATTHVDASVFYNISPSLRLTLEAINLTNQREEQYSDTADRLYNTTESGVTYYLGLNYKF